MAKYLRDISIECDVREPRWREFNRESGCVDSLFYSNFRKFEAGGCKKVVVCLYSVDPPEQNPVQMLIDVAVVHKRCDLDAYWALEDIQAKKRFVLDVLREGLHQAAETFGWDKKPFDDAYEACLAANLEYQFSIFKRPVRSPSKRYKAQVECVHGLHQIDVYIVLFDRSGAELKRACVGKLQPGELLARWLITSLEWDDDRSVRIPMEMHPQVKKTMGIETWGSFGMDLPSFSADGPDSSG